ncbi:MAG TPA: hypothetical protein VFZ34_23395 [Blastocatellia bacterium]|nr:hypothetical protein [Blastocatellia bacterium]
MKSSHTFACILLSLLLFGAFSTRALASDISGPSEATGSLLVFPYFNSDLANGWDTRITIANTDVYRREGTIGPVLTTAYVHIFLIDGATCYQSDQFVCLTPNATLSFLASDLDPDVRGYVIAVAVDRDTGNLVNQNSLIGDAFVSEGNYGGNYGAEGFQAYGDPGINQDGVIHFGNLMNGYDYAPTRFAFSIQSPIDAPGQRIVTASISGDVNTGEFAGAGQYGIGYVYNGNEKPFGSFSAFHLGGCQAVSIITPTLPRVPFGMAKLIPSGEIGTMTLSTKPAVGLLMTPTGNNKWHGIRGLHKTRIANATLTIPMFTPVC